MVVEFFQRLCVLLYNHVALFVPISIDSPWMRLVLAKRVVNELLIEDLDTLNRCHLQLLSESLERQSDQDFEELVADELALRV